MIEDHESIIKIKKHKKLKLQERQDVIICSKEGILCYS